MRVQLPLPGRKFRLVASAPPRRNGFACATVLIATLLAAGGAAVAAEAPAPAAASAEASPVNQVFQFVQSGTWSTWADGSTTNATAYLWVPENCRRVRGLLILCSNVPEHRLVGHPAIRRVCEANDLGIVWCVPSFMNFRKGMPDDRRSSVAFLQQLLDGLARTSGYEEVATVPWLPMGESGHLLMVDALVETLPDRCIAGIWIKNNHLPPKDRHTPALVAFGTAQEWSQDKTDIRTHWRDVGPAYETILKQRRDNPDWPLSYVIDGSSGHFDCSERLTAYFAGYIDQVAKARLSPDGSAALRPVSMEKGFLADLPVPGRGDKPVLPYAQAQADARALPWYFDEPAAAEAKAIAAINWDAQTQLPAFLGPQGNVLPFDFNGITRIKSVEWEPDHVTFSVRGTMLDEIPAGFVGAGQKLAKAPGEPTAEWLCGPLAPLGGGRFRVALDRTWGHGAAYVALRHAGTDQIRSVVQPANVDMPSLKNSAGKRQVITFPKPADVKAGTASVPLTATSDSGLPVEYFVVAGPAVVREGRLVFTPIPPRTKFPVAVTVSAWQWGSDVEPKVRTADVVTQTLNVLPPRD